MDQSQYQAKRAKLQAALPEGYKDNVYMEPPDKSKIKYPCIIWDYDEVEKLYADDIPYMINKRYNVMVIDYDNMSSVSEALLELPMSSFVTKYKADGLSHYVHNIFL